MVFPSNQHRNMRKNTDKESHRLCLNGPLHYHKSVDVDDWTSNVNYIFEEMLLLVTAIND